MEPVAVTYESLDPGYVFILDVGAKIFIWNGKKAKNTLKSKSRLMCEKINKNERKNRSEIITITTTSMQAASECREFWTILGVDDGLLMATDEGLMMKVISVPVCLK